VETERSSIAENLIIQRKEFYSPAYREPATAMIAYWREFVYSVGASQRFLVVDAGSVFSHRATLIPWGKEKSVSSIHASLRVQP
jgi:hypothetical protein